MSSEVFWIRTFWTFLLPTFLALLDEHTVSISQRPRDYCWIRRNLLSTIIICQRQGSCSFLPSRKVCLSSKGGTGLRCRTANSAKMNQRRNDRQALIVGGKTETTTEKRKKTTGTMMGYYMKYGHDGSSLWIQRLLPDHGDCANSPIQIHRGGKCWAWISLSLFSFMLSCHIEQLGPKVKYSLKWHLLLEQETLSSRILEDCRVVYLSLRLSYHGLYHLVVVVSLILFRNKGLAFVSTILYSCMQGCNSTPPILSLLAVHWSTFTHWVLIRH